MVGQAVGQGGVLGPGLCGVGDPGESSLGHHQHFQFLSKFHFLQEMKW